MQASWDVLVVGSGAAGLATALECADAGRVCVISKASLNEGATAWAQGGIAAVMDPADSFAQHAADTLATGGALADPEVVAAVVAGGPGRIETLLKLGAQFSREGNADAALDLTQEGGHSARRIVHANDRTGQEIHRVLLEAAKRHENITLLEDTMGIDLILEAQSGRVTGLYALEVHSGAIRSIQASVTVLATGGAGKVYLYTSNPDVATGDGIAMAYRAGARVANMEFFQFHPTCLYHPQAKNFLISEALRGEGALLRLPSGERFMPAYDPAAELAPRDVVARAIDYELKRHGLDYVLLDITHREASYLRSRFPMIAARCEHFGIDLTREAIPVVPAAHYLCGGIEVDADGRTDLAGLYAVGEAAHTGLHGANRLASNSLLEGLHFAHRCAQHIRHNHAQLSPPSPAAPWDSGSAVAADEAIVVHHNWDELRRCMWNYVGIVRSMKRLERARRRIDLLEAEIRAYYWAHLVTQDLLELRNIATVARLIVESASNRQESRGLHYMVDFPERSERFLGPTFRSRDR